ncbi:hypothetical protein Cabther_B0661 [Chloracidobacterium thermophilum B]|uniref:Uncharacterized protein n=1 Tax=Chloracidobacterium thermophilum (strain B) TaxID=981222 RepID=G2LKQ2_CHLTF|nr:hypothetical protein Cabther_B0661 [Chloracidobacterium thermophilum B]
MVQDSRVPYLSSYISPVPPTTRLAVGPAPVISLNLESRKP